MSAMLVLAVALMTGGCNKNDVSDLVLDRTVEVLGISIDNYEGVIDNKARKIKVGVPATYDLSAMKVTGLSLPEGAEASIKVGDVLCCQLPVDVRIKNGDVYLDYVLEVQRDNAVIETFYANGLYSGRIDNNTNTIVVNVPKGTDITAIAVTYTCNEGTTCTPESGSIVDFSGYVEFVAKHNTATRVYAVTINVVEGGTACFVGTAPSIDLLENMEEKTAAQWMIKNVPMAEYVCFDDIVSGMVDLSNYKVVWWHMHANNGDNPPTPQSAISAIHAFRNYYLNGGNLLLTRYASFYIANEDASNIKGIGIAKDGRWPNNSWGANEDHPEIVGGPWSFFITAGHEEHPIFQGLLYNEGEPDKVYTCDTGYGITNSTAQWHIGVDWGGYNTIEDWRTLTGGIDLAHGGDGAVVMAEFPNEGTHGRVIVIGSGCYDWYSSAMDAFSDRYHVNVERMTLNAIDYLSTDVNN